MSLLLLTLTAACMQPLQDIPKVTADFRFSNATGLGIQNAGFLDLGTMYVWDISNNVLHPIGVAGLDVAPKRKVLPGFQASKGVQGVKVSGVPVNLSGQNGLIATEIGKETKFSVEGAIREEYRNVKRRLNNMCSTKYGMGTILLRHCIQGTTTFGLS